ncbi:hypothetical protein WB904_002863 [Vibrio parahaemolyticus]
MNNKKRFAEILITNMAIYEKEVSGPMLNIWLEDLGQFDIHAIEQAFQRHRTNPDNGRFAPKPADITRLIGGTSSDRALSAWAKVKRGISSAGAYSTVVFDDVLIHTVLTDMGGWEEICRTNVEEMPFVAKEFENRYRTELFHPSMKHPKKLIGTTERENVSNGIGVTEPPITIGNIEQCRLTYKTGSNSTNITGMLSRPAANDDIQKIGVSK